MEGLGIWWRAVYYGMPALEILLGGYCFYRLVRPFVERARCAVGAGAVYSLTMLMIYVTSWRLTGWFDNFTGYGLGIFAAFLVMCWTDRRNYRQKAFLAVTFFALRKFSFAMAEIIYDKTYDYMGNTDYMINHPNLSFALYTGVCVLYLTAEFLLMSVGIWCILKNYSDKRAPMSMRELLVLVLPSFLGLAGYEIIQCYRSFYIRETGEASKSYDNLSLLYYLASVVTIVVFIVLYQRIKAGQEEKIQNELLTVQMKEIRQHIEQVEGLYRDIYGLRHDMTNHLITLERLYVGGRTEEARLYGTELKNALSQTGGEIRSGNPVTDVILQGIRNEAERRKIEFRVDFHYPADDGVNAFDISVILNNALQNALEGAEKSEKPHISILSYRRNNAYMIEISNSFAGRLQWDAESGLPLTSKSNQYDSGYRSGNLQRSEAVHGYGLANIRKVAEKYLGDIAIDITEGEFRLSIMLMLE